MADDELLEMMEEEYDDEHEKSGGCYIATAVYGSYDCPPVWVLRRFRDRYLANKLWGRVFIKVYYFISPKLVSLFAHYKWFGAVGERILNPFVAKLKRSGYEDTAYKD